MIINNTHGGGMIRLSKILGGDITDSNEERRGRDYFFVTKWIFEGSAKSEGEVVEIFL